MVTSFKTNILSNTYPELKKYNKKQSKKSDLRMGEVVMSGYGLGIVTHVSKDDYHVAVTPENENHGWVVQYRVPKGEIHKVDHPIDLEIKLYRGAWMIIEDYAKQLNQRYEVDKGNSIVSDLSWTIKAKREERVSKPGFGGSRLYRRYTGTNPKGESFDFELAAEESTYFADGDRVLFALGMNDGYISHLDGTGWVSRRKLEYRDVNYGLCKYVLSE